MFKDFLSLWYLSEWVCVLCVQVPADARIGSQFPGAAIIGPFEHPDMSARNWAQLLCSSTMFPNPLSHLSSP